MKRTKDLVLKELKKNLKKLKFSIDKTDVVIYIVVEIEQTKMSSATSQNFFRKIFLEGEY